MQNFFIIIVPAAYAFAMAAALSGSVTHAFSCSIILMEMGGLVYVNVLMFDAHC